MIVKVIAEIATSNGVIPPGQIIEVPPFIAELKDKVVPLSDGKENPTYCQVGNCWCSSRIPRFAHECRKCGESAGERNPKNETTL